MNFICYGLLHKPINIKEAMQISRSVDNSWDKDFEKTGTEGGSGSTNEERQKNCSFCFPHGSLPLESELAKHLQKGRQSRGPGRTTLKITTDTKQYSQSKAHQLLKWQQQDSWIRFPDSPCVAGDVATYTQVHMSQAPRLLRLLENRAHLCGYDSHVVEYRNIGTQSMNWLLLSSDTLTVILWHCFGKEDRMKYI